MNKELEVAIEYLKTFEGPVQEASKNSMFAHAAGGCLVVIHNADDFKRKDGVDYWVWRCMKLLNEYAAYLYKQAQAEYEKEKENE